MPGLPPDDFAETSPVPSQSGLDVVGSQIGPYRVLERIGQGGFGVVYLAEQRHPVRRKVALKILKPGMDSTEVLARFEAALEISPAAPKLARRRPAPPPPRPAPAPRPARSSAR